MNKVIKISKDYVKDNLSWMEGELARKKWSEVMEHILESDPFCGHDYYIYTFIKSHKLNHQVRVTQPDPLPGTTCQRVEPKNGMKISIIWTLPHEEGFHQYKKGGLFENKDVEGFIEAYKKGLLDPDPSKDPPREEIVEIYKEKKRREDKSHTL